MGRDLMVALFATTAGFTVSGILANLYRLIVKTPDNNNVTRGAYYAVMVLAGPNVLLENAAAKLREKSCSKWAFWLAAAISAYWSFAIGLFVLNIYIVLR
jgi:hypothetical protein